MSAKRRSLLLVLLLVTAVALLPSHDFLDQAGSELRGRRLANHLRSFDQEFAACGVSTSFEEAVRASGSNSIPVLVGMLQESDPVRDRFVSIFRNQHLFKFRRVRSIDINFLGSQGFSALGEKGVDALPLLIEILDSDRPPWSQAAAAAALGNIGPAADRGIPALLRILSGNRTIPKCFACNALGKIHGRAGLVVPALAKSIADSDHNVRAEAIVALGSFGRDAKLAVPNLIQTLQNPDPGVQASARKALERVDPALAKEIGIAKSRPPLAE